MADLDYDEELRGAAMSYVARLQDIGGEVIASDDLRAFTFDGRSIPLVQQRGIVKVSGLPAALTIRTTYARRPEDRPYDDHDGEDGFPRYKWQGTDPDDYDNVALRVAMDHQKKLIWFRGIARAQYLAIQPVWIVGEEPESRQFTVAIDADLLEQWTGSDTLQHPADLALRRQYAESIVRQRIHQPIFRRRVLAAYRSQCAVCRLRHDELLDAAHIKEDADGGQPVVPNGLAMCAIHHRAFDSNVLGITPTYEVRIRPDVLEEQDGPTLRYALQGLHKARLIVPRVKAAHPSSELLEERYERFLSAS